MELKHNFTVAVPVAQAWEVLLDLERIAPCMPGATLTSHEGDEFAGTVRVKLGPVTMTFAGKGRFVERDAEARRMVIEAAGKDRSGGGSARATIRASLQPVAPDPEAPAGQSGATEHTAVEVHTDLVVTGRAAQFGRGMIGDVSTRLLGQFTDCLSGQLGAGETAAPAAAAASPAAEPAAAPGTAEAAGSGGGAPAEVADGKPAATAPAAPAEAEPIDLLAVTGIRAATLRFLPYLVVFVVGALVGAGLVAWLG